MKKPDLSIPTRNASMFTWSGKIGSVEASELPNGFMGDRVWNDSTDVGFWVYSPRTDQTKLFVFSHVEFDRADREVVHWEYACVEDPSIVVRIFND